MQKLYDRIYWKNNSVPALNESNLNAMSKGLDEVDTRLTELAVGITNIDDSVEQARASEETARKYASQVYHYTPAGYPDLVARADMVSNPNLLDNGWFNVNSRGQSSYSGTGYCVDRWKGNYDTSITVHDGYINRAGYWGITQAGKWKSGTYTLSVWARTNNADGFYLSLSTGATYTIPLRKDNTWQIIKHTFSVSSSLEWLSLGVSPRPASYDIKAVKLELGSISTLEHDTAPNSAEELIRCQASTADASDTYANKGVLTDDAWVSTKTYEVGELFIDNDIMYRTKVRCSNVKPPNATYYEPTRISEELRKYIPSSDLSTLNAETGIATQTITIPKDGYYFITSNLRLYGGSGTYPNYVYIYRADISSGDADYGATVHGQYTFTTIARFEYLTAGTHTWTYKTGARPTSFVIRTRMVKI